MKNFLYRIALNALLVLAILFGLNVINDFIPRDDSDPRNGGRSGMSVFTDYLTGCQYLGLRGTLTPRLDKNSKQICIEVVQ
jgi:hypothetical protein